MYVIVSFLFKLFPLISFLFFYFVYIHFKKWITIWNISKKLQQRFIRIYFFIGIFSLLPWIITSYYGLKPSIIFPNWFKNIYLFPSYIIILTHFVCFFFLLLYDLIFFLFFLSKKINATFNYFRHKKNCKIMIDQNKRYLLKRAMIVFPASFITISTIGVFSSEYDLSINRVKIKIKNLDEKLKGFKITQISDFHFGMFMEEKRFLKFAKEVNLLNSNLIVITGDIINSSVNLIPMVQKSLMYLKSDLGIYSCVGNHEYYTGFLSVVEGLKKIGVKVLINKSHLIKYRGASFYLLGVDYPMISSNSNYSKKQLIQKHLAKAFSYVTRKEFPKILLAHHPDTFDEAVNYDIDLILCGHTHGGQIVFSPWGNESLSVGKLGFKYVKGYYKKLNSQLYVNSGLGHWLPMRFNCPVEITQLILE